MSPSSPRPPHLTARSARAWLRSADPDRFGATVWPAPAEAAPVVPGYRLLSPAGAGGSATVWKAERLSDGAAVALKLARPDNDPAAAARWRREAAALRELQHDNVVALLDAGECDGRPWLAMEWVDGSTLSSRLPAGGMTWDRAMPVIRQIMEAVTAAHARGIVHRDLKPANILLTHDGRVKVADFGLARQMDAKTPVESLSRTGLVAGTVEYLAPECYTETGEPGRAADVFALGVMLYEMLAGAPPRGAWTGISLIRKVDVRVDALIVRAMDPDPGRRPEAAEMLRELGIIARTPGRYAGEPFVTVETRMLDAAWTLCGLTAAWLAFTVLLESSSSGIRLPGAVFAGFGGPIGTFVGAGVLLAMVAVMMLWQSARLWRFRAMPLRAALPIPFGIGLPGHGPGTAAGLAASQAGLAVWPAGVAALCLSGLQWHDSRANGAVRALAVVDAGGEKVTSLWSDAAPAIFETGQCWLAEQTRHERQVLTTHAQIAFVPLLVPGLMALAGGVAAGGLLLTGWRAARALNWRRPAAWGSVAALGGLAVTWNLAQAGHERRWAARQRETVASFTSLKGVSPDESSRIKAWTRALMKCEDSGDIPGLLTKCAPVVSWRSEGLLDHSALARHLSASHPPAGTSESWNEGILSVVRVHGAAIRVVARQERFRDAETESEGAVVERHYWLESSGDSWRLQRTMMDVEPVYRASRQSLSSGEATALIDDWVSAWAAADWAKAADFIQHRRFSSTGDREPITQGVIYELVPKGTIYAELERTGPVEITAAPGARWICRFGVLHRTVQPGSAPVAVPMTWTLELVRIGARWRAVRVRF